MSGSSPLHALADRVGIIPEYLDQTGREVRRTSDATRVALLRAMGIEAGTEEDASAALAALEERERARLLDPVRVVPLPRARAMRAHVTLPDALREHPVRWEVELDGESGERHTARGRASASRAGSVAVSLPAVRQIGYHRLRLRLTAAAGPDRTTREAEQSLIVVPASCPTTRERLGGRPVMGVIANLYTVRSARNWGIGDLEDLARLLAWSAAIGAEFVGVNPLHALRNRGIEISPYSPVSRVYRNPLYVDPEQVPELAESSAARDVLASADAQRELAALRAGERVEYQRAWTLKRVVLRELHAAFASRHRDRDTPRGRAYAEWRRQQGEPLVRFATFMALDEHFTQQGRDDGASGWPEPLRAPDSAAVREFAEAHREDVDFHCWVQFELDRQMAEVAARGATAGLAIGLYQDLAIGTSPSGSDVWSYPELFVRGVSVGAPPDPYSATGQNWGLPPIDPRRLREDGYRYWIELVRASLRHAGALRIDHVMGLFRQFWIPEGKSGTDGAYVRFPSDDLLGILALESTRAGAIVVGEDLGTVPDDVPPALERWGILSSKVLYFERDERGRFLPAASYPAQALATANTHDMPTLAGFWTGRDIDLREQVGLCDAREAEEARREREREREELVRRFSEEGVLPPPADGRETGTDGNAHAHQEARAGGASATDEPTVDALRIRAAAHAFLCSTPSALVGLSLDDLAGEIEPVNVPGVAPDRFPSWTRRMRLSLEELAFDPGVAAALRCGERMRGPARAGSSATKRPGATTKARKTSAKSAKSKTSSRSASKAPSHTKSRAPARTPSKKRKRT